MEKLCCCFSSSSDGPSLDVELKCVTTCCISHTRNLDVDIVDGADDDNENMTREFTLCCFKCKKETCKHDTEKKKKANHE